MAQEELVRIIQTFLNESMRYFKDITDISVFTNIFLSICRILLREKKGFEGQYKRLTGWRYSDIAALRQSEQTLPFLFANRRGVYVWQKSDI